MYIPSYRSVNRQARVSLYTAVSDIRRFATANREAAKIHYEDKREDTKPVTSCHLGLKSVTRRPRFTRI